MSTSLFAVRLIAALVLSYFIGTLNSSFLLGKAVKQKDIRDYGSGNPGSTNAIRTFGPKFGFLCMGLDILKGALAIIFTRLIFGVAPFINVGLDKWDHTPLVLIELICGIVCMLGHMYPFYMKFKGGKGIAASLGILLTVDWRVFLYAGIPALIILAVFRIMSVASLSFETLIFIFYIVVYSGNDYFWWILPVALLYPVLGFYGHRGNIKRLLHNQEPRLWGKGSKKDLAQKEQNQDGSSDNV